MRDDAELLRSYATEHSEAAFAELVQRHLNLVYRSALRQLGGDAHRAEDVTQLVFTLLARKAAALANHPSLAGWLYTTTHRTVGEVLRAERRRRKREQEAQTMHELTSGTTSDSDWDRLRPLLDDVMQDLNSTDRDAILLRFFEERPFGEIGTKLALSEDAARMRVERALDKLHGLLARRGFASTSATLAAMLTTEAGVAAPASLSAMVTGAALAGAVTPVAAGAGTAIAVKILYFMSTTKVAIVIVATALVAIGAAFYQSAEARKAHVELVAAASREKELGAKLESLQQRLVEAEQRAEAADQDSAVLLKAVQDFKATGGESNVPITHDIVEARYKKAQELAKNGQFEEALKEFLWCYDVGMPRVSGYAGVRSSFLLSEIVKLGQKYPEALAALRTRRDQAGQRMLASTNDTDAATDFSAINRVLKEDGSTLALYDQLPAGDVRRRTMANAAYEQLVAAQRYNDAMEGRPYAMMSSLFELSVQERPSIAAMPNADMIRKANHDNVLRTTAKNVEVLAGAGDLVHAGQLADRLLAYDGSEATRTLLQQHATRAGHPELLTTPAKP